MIVKKHLYYLFLFLCLTITTGKAQSLHNLSEYDLVERQLIDRSHSELFASLQVQDFQGRIKPVHTMSLELLRKIHKKSSFSYVDSKGNKLKLSPTQVFVGMMMKSDSWQLLPIIKIDSKALFTLKDDIEITSTGYAKPASFFNFKGEYKLKKMVADAFSKNPGKRNAFDKAIINIDERVNIIWGLFAGKYLKIFPSKDLPNNKWLNPVDSTGVTQEIFRKYFNNVQSSLVTKDWAIPNQIINKIKNSQIENANPKVLLSDKRVQWEISYNTFSPFFISLISYTVLGTLLLLITFLELFYEKLWINVLSKVILSAVILVFLLHGMGIGVRWYISNHAPWSNGYEATVFISWVGVLSSLFYIRKSNFPIAAMSLISVCLLGIAHGNLMSPEVTNLVPVLKSYWLMIHVAIITSSYGFLTLGSVLSLLVFILILLTNSRKKEIISKKVDQLTAINQVTTTIGLYLLTIGTFLGGIWANESWGRYWGWDPKETWALISIIIYAFVLHLRIILPNKSTFVYNVCSLFALSSLIMTFFGVNYYLAGLHSYAKGDSFPIPDWIYPALIIVILIVFLSFRRYKKHY